VWLEIFEGSDGAEDMLGDRDGDVEVDVDDGCDELLGL